MSKSDYTRVANLLLRDYPLMILPRLAIAIGLNEAIVVQQVHYRLQRCEEDPVKNADHFRDGHWWVYNTIEQWRETNFPFWSYETIKRIFASLRQPCDADDKRKGSMPRNALLLTRSDLNKKGFDQTIWYTIDYAEIIALERRIVAYEKKAERGKAKQQSPPRKRKTTQALGQNDPMDQGKVTQALGQNDPMDQVKVTQASGQDDSMDQVKVTQPIPETTAPETTSEITRDNNNNTGTDDVGPDSDSVYTLLAAFGVELSVAKRLAGADPPHATQDVRGWIRYAESQRRVLRNPPGFVISKLEARDPPPPTPDCPTAAHLAEFVDEPEPEPDPSVEIVMANGMTAKRTWQVCLDALLVYPGASALDGSYLQRFDESEHEFCVVTQADLRLDYLERFVDLATRILRRMTYNEPLTIRFATDGQTEKG